MAFNGEAFGGEIVSMVKDHLAREIAPLLARIAELERREAPSAGPGPAGVGVADASVNESGVLVLRLTDGTTHEAGLVVGKDGRDGWAGNDGAAGRDGIDGQAGKDGERGPAGSDGKDGAAGRDGADGKNGERGHDGKDGVGLAGMLIDREGGLVATLCDGTMRSLGVVVGKDGAAGQDGEAGKDGRDGTNGADGLGFEDMDERLEDAGRTVIRTYRRGDVVKEFRFALPALLDRGVYKDGSEYAAGDGVTWAGSFWIAQRSTSAKPDAGDGSWRLAVKRGRDGKDGKA